MNVKHIFNRCTIVIKTSILKENIKLVRESSKDGVFEGKYAQHTYRGIEKFEGNRMVVSSSSIEAVLTEQERQKLLDINDVNEIAVVYLRNGSAISQKLASAIGKSDHMLTLQYINEKSIKANAGNTKLRATLRWIRRKAKSARAA